MSPGRQKGELEISCQCRLGLLQKGAVLHQTDVALNRYQPFAGPVLRYLCDGGAEHGGAAHPWVHRHNGCVEGGVFHVVAYLRLHVDVTAGHLVNVVEGTTGAGPEITFFRRYQVVVEVQVVVWRADVELESFQGRTHVIAANLEESAVARVVDGAAAHPLIASDLRLCLRSELNRHLRQGTAVMDVVGEHDVASIPGKQCMIQVGQLQVRIEVVSVVFHGGRLCRQILCILSAR